MKRMMAGRKYFWRFASFKMGWLESSYFQRGSHLSMMTNDDADADDDDEDVAKRSLALVHPDFFFASATKYVYICLCTYMCIFIR
jgi:hypothetical protein